MTTATRVFPVVDTYPDPWVPDVHPTRNIFVVAAGHERGIPQRAGNPRATESFEEAIARMCPYPVREGIVLTDDAAPLEPLARRTMEIMRNRTREYLPVNVLYY